MTKINKAQRNAIFSRIFGNNIQRAREYVAAFLIKLGVTPDAITICGMIITIVSSVYLALGAGDYSGYRAGQHHSWYAFIAAWGIILAAACDILDGAIARNTGHTTAKGAFLDSCTDRISDSAIFIGIAIYYLRHPEITGAFWFVIATMIALSNALTISYTKARAENFIDRCPVGYWQRGERIAGILIGLFCGHIATVMFMLAILAGFTVLRRMIFAARQIHRYENKLPLLDSSTENLKGIMKLAWWRFRRGTFKYDMVTAFNICLILFIDLQGWFNNQ